MMTTYFILLMLLEPGDGPKPMKVMPGDPIIDLALRTTDNGLVMLADVSHDSFCFFMSASCPACRSAIPVIRDHFQENHVVWIFVDEGLETKEFVAEHGLNEAYLVRAEDLVPHQITSLPGVLAYRDGKLKYAFHGPIDQKECRIMKHYQER